MEIWSSQMPRILTRVTTSAKPVMVSDQAKANSFPSSLMVRHPKIMANETPTRLGWNSLNFDTLSVPPSFGNFPSLQTASINPTDHQADLPVIKCLVKGDKPLHISWNTGFGLQIRPESQHQQFQVSKIAKKCQIFYFDQILLLDIFECLRQN